MQARFVQWHRRRGSMYVAVIGCSLVVTVIGVSALLAARIERRAAEGTSDLSDARVYAQSAIDLGMYTILSDANWRSNKSGGPWKSNQPIGDGTYSLSVVDPIDGILSNSTSDPVVLSGTGSMGQSRYKLQVTMVAKSNALTCLQVAMHAGTSLTFNSATVQSNLVTISANGSATTAGSSMIYPKVEAVGIISGTGYLSSQTPGITPRTMPAATVFDYYKTNGTSIPYSSIGSSQGKVTMEKKVLSPANNPYGSVKNPNGIYVIDCAFGNLRIRDYRIVGTLVVLNPGVFSIENSVLWEPAVANYPSLLVSGNATFNFTSTALSESSLGANFNPAGTPYQGAYNSTMLDTYPSVINGLVYASGAVTTSSTVTINGVLVVGTTLTSQNNLNLSYLSTFYDNPPPGFGAAPEMVISPGTWKQLVD